MMMRALLFLCLVMISPVASAQDGAPILPADPMRGLIWGLPMSEVSEFERAKKVATPEEGGDNSLFYAAIIDVMGTDYKALVDYQFDEGGALAQIRYDFSIQSTTPNDCINHMMQVQRWMDMYTGQQSQPDFNFRFDYDEKNTNKWGWAVYRGDALITTDWQTPVHYIKLTLSGGNYQPRLRLVLTPPLKAKTP